MRYLLYLISSIALAQSIQVHTPALPTSAIVTINGSSGACSLSLIDNTNGATVGTSPTLVNQGSSKVYVFSGLRSGAPHTLTVSGCASLVKSFTTGSWGNGATYPLKFATDSTKWGNRAGPTITINTTAPVIDPVYGASITPIANAKWFTWRSCGASACGSSAIAAESTYTTGTWTPQGSGCDIAHGSATCYSTTSGTAPIDLYYNLKFPAWNNANINYALTQTLHDIGLIMWASGVPFDVCMFFNASSGCVGSSFTVTPSGGSVALVPGASSGQDPDTAWPTSFPSAGFTGWGSPNFTLDRLTTYPSATVSSGSPQTISMTPSYYAFNSTVGANAANYFADTLGVGSKILCGSSLGTVVSNVNAGSITTTGCSSGTQTISAYGWGIRITPHSGGTLNLGVRLKLAGNYASGAQALGTSFQPVSFAHNGENFNLAIVTTSIAGYGLIGAFGDQGSIVPVSGMQIPTGSAPDGPSTAAGVGHPASGGYFWDTSTAGVYYNLQANTSATPGYSIYKIDCSSALSSLNPYDQNYGAGAVGGFPSGDGCSWTNLTPPSHSPPLDIESQIEAYDPRWQIGNKYSNLYGSGGQAWMPSNGNVTFAGTTGHYAIINLIYDSQDIGSNWIAAFDLNTGLLARLRHTFDAEGGSGVGDPLRFCAAHSVQTFAYPLNTVLVTCDNLAANNTYWTLGGPFQFGSVTMSKGGTFVSDVSLPAAIGSGNGYDAACGSSIAAKWQALGATGNNCFTINVAKGGPNNVYANATEKGYFPSLWTSPGSNNSQPIICVDSSISAICEGMMFHDQGQGSGVNGSQAEQFRIVKVIDPAPSVTNQTQLIVQRNASWDVCSSSINGAHTGGWGVANTALTTHSSASWVMEVGGGQSNSCSIASYLWNISDNSVQEISYAVSGHLSVGHGTPTDSAISWVSALGSLIRPQALMGNLPTIYNPFQPVASKSTQGFAGISSLIGAGITQSYPNLGKSGPSGFALDSNMILGQSASPEKSDAPLGTRTMSATATQNVYTLTQLSIATAINNTTYKQVGIYGWAGYHTLKDISGPTSDITANPWTMCWVYQSSRNECYPGSTAGQIYVNVPQAYDDGYAYSGVSWFNSPAVVSAPPMSSEWRTFDFRLQDETGSGSQPITAGGCGPGYGYAVTGGFIHPSGKYMLSPGPCTWNGVAQMGFYAKIPGINNSSVPVNSFINLPVKFPSGVNTYARVEFGYNSNYYASDYAEITVTDNSITPYAFASSDSPANPTSCTTGCTVNIPAIAGRPIYFQRQTAPSSTGPWTNYMGPEVIGIN